MDPEQHEPADAADGDPGAGQRPSGNIRTLDFVLYRVQFQPFNFTGPSYKTGLSCSIAGRALFSPGNELGTAFADGQGQRIGRLVAWPGVPNAGAVAFTAEPFQSAVHLAAAGAARIWQVICTSPG